MDMDTFLAGGFEEHDEGERDAADNSSDTSQESLEGAYTFASRALAPFLTGCQDQGCSDPPVLRVELPGRFRLPSDHLPA
jgi:hypothetical protein